MKINQSRNKREGEYRDRQLGKHIRHSRRPAIDIYYVVSKVESIMKILPPILNKEAK